MNLLRQLGPHEHARVGFIELFFDLVFVFAITQLSHLVLTAGAETAIVRWRRRHAVRR